MENGKWKTEKGKGGGDDQVALAHAGGDDAQVKASSAAGDGDSVARPDVGGEALLELANTGADAEVGGLEYPGHRLDLGGGEVGGRHRNVGLAHTTLPLHEPVTYGWG